MRVIGILLVGMVMSIHAGDDNPRSYLEAYADALMKIDRPACIQAAQGVYHHIYANTQQPSEAERVRKKIVAPSHSPASPIQEKDVPIDLSFLED